MGEAIPKEAVPKEGSMEDILASIRRIISADSSKSEKAQHIEPASVDVSAKAASENPVPVEPIRKPISADAQKPVTRSLSALADQIRSERSLSSGEASVAAPAVEKPAPMQTENETPAPVVPAPAAPPAEAKSVEKPATLSALAQQVKQESVAKTAESVPEEKSNDAPAKTKLEETEVTSTTGSDKPALSLKELADKVSEAAKPVLPQSAEEKTDVLASAMGAAAKTELEYKPVPKVSETTEKTEKPAIIVSKQVDKTSLSAFKDALVAPSTQAAVSDSMDRLRKSVEDVDAAQVENILRPMLKSWLDDHLPSMVERLVQQEISKITAKK